MLYMCPSCFSASLRHRDLECVTDVLYTQNKYHRFNVPSSINTNICTVKKIFLFVYIQHNRWFIKATVENRHKGNRL